VGPGNHEANCDYGGTTNKAENITYTVSICVPSQTNFTFACHRARAVGWVAFGILSITAWYTTSSWTLNDLGHGFVAPEDAGAFTQVMNAQTDWLKKDRPKTPWVVVSGHRAWYISFQNQTSDVCLMCQDVLSGHCVRTSGMRPLPITIE
jgi:hypothetical protein